MSFPSLDGEASAPVVLTGFLFAPPVSPAPAVALFHGCDGIYDRRAPEQRMRDYAAFFNAAGFHVLVVDSLTPRYETELCTQRAGKRRVTLTNRRLDALGAVAYLAGRSDVDAQKIGIVGWSNGASTVLAATNLRHADVASALARPAFAVAFYPACEADLRRGYEPAAPLLLLAGQLDDWTAAAPCVHWSAPLPSRGRRSRSTRARTTASTPKRPAHSQGRAERRQPGARRARRRQCGGVARVARPLWFLRRREH